MKITIQRHGGFAGTNEVLDILDTKSLSAEREAAVRGVLGRMQRLEPSTRAVGADFIHHEILIEEGGAQQTLSFVDDGSDKAHELLELLNTILAANKRSS
jgi:hypothetical protein